MAGGCQLVFCEYDGDNVLVIIAIMMVRTGKGIDDRPVYWWLSAGIL